MSDTLAKLQAHLAKREPGSWSRLPKIECTSGLTMSIQCGEALYCSPRDNHGPWTAVEVGYVSKPVRGLSAYGQRWRPDGVYGWVPLEVVAKIVDRNGGLV